MNTVCLSLGGLPAGMLGAYGNSWIQTPAANALAAQSLLFDRFYAAGGTARKNLSAFWQCLPDGKKILVTDSKNVFALSQTHGFDQQYFFKPLRRTMPAKTLAHTAFFINFALLADKIQTLGGEPFFLWAYFDAFHGCWDFPLSYRQRYQAPEDPEPYSGTEPPFFDNAASALPPDLIQSVMESYSGGVTVFDDALASLLTFLETEHLAEKTLFILTAADGFALGSHRRIGRTEELYSENIHLPFLCRFPGCRYAGVRSQALLQPSDMFPLLAAAEIPEESASVHPFLRIEDSALLSPEWLLYRKASGSELYAKPDDRWEANDVADRCPQIIEEMQKMF